jgi:hypothetical protein
MNVPNIEIGSGSVTAIPRVDVTGLTAPSANARSARTTSAPTTSSISLTRLAWFDANGDGEIDTRAAGAGGDATLLVPAHQVDLPTYGRAAHPAPGSRPESAVKATSGAADHTPVQTQRAVAAYQRYGQAPAAPAAPTSVAALPSASPDAVSATPGAPLSAVA